MDKSDFDIIINNLQQEKKGLYQALDITIEGKDLILSIVEKIIVDTQANTELNIRQALINAIKEKQAIVIDFFDESTFRIMLFCIACLLGYHFQTYKDAFDEMHKAYKDLDLNYRFAYSKMLKMQAQVFELEEQLRQMDVKFAGEIKKQDPTVN